MSFNKEQARVAVIGAGIAGISTAIALKRQLQFENFLIFESASDIGGTWRDNTYPGCGVDITGHWYSLSTDLNPNWSSYYVGQAEILAYWRSLVQKYTLAPHILLNTRVTSVEWDVDAQLYRMTLTDTTTGATREELAEAVVSAMGLLSNPAFPADLPGKDAFRGELFHSARWRHDVDLHGKRVGVIGNGCSAAQFVPEISNDAAVEVINFCRTPEWFAPKLNYSYKPWMKWTFANIPLGMRAYRTFIATMLDIRFRNFQQVNKDLIDTRRKLLTKYMTIQAPDKYHDKIIPNYSPGCKRIIVDPGYLNALHRPNVSLNWDGISEIIPEGIKTKTGEVVPLDVIIFATGFNAATVKINIKGSNGNTLQEFFKSQGGPTAYLGTTVAGFPNFFMLMGPNSATGHASVIFSEESQINYALQLIKPVIERTAQSFEIERTAFDAYNARIQQRLARTVFTECASYYKGGDGKNFAIFPGPLTLLWWWTRTPRWEHYKAVGAQKWDAQRRWRVWRRRLLGMCAVVVALGLKNSDARAVVWTVLEQLQIKIGESFGTLLQLAK